MEDGTGEKMVRAERTPNGNVRQTGRRGGRVIKRGFLVAKRAVLLLAQFPSSFFLSWDSKQKT
jgi:hypothetical protein